MCSQNFMHSQDEHEKSSITAGLFISVNSELTFQNAVLGKGLLNFIVRRKWEVPK